MSAGKAKLVVAPCPPAPPPGPSPAVIEELYRKASLLHHGLYGLYTKAKDDGEHQLADEDLWPFWELSTELLVGLRNAHEGT